jgi:dTMP kinase
VEGIDGSGKSTQLSLLRRWLEAEGYKVFFTQWNSSNLVKETTRMGKKKKNLTPTTFSLLHATDFADRFNNYILPPLKAGMIVLADRYIFTAFARDVVRGVDPRWVRKLYSFAVAPDISFYFKVPIDMAIERITGARTKIKYYEAGMDLELSDDITDSFRLFQGSILNEYDKLVREYRMSVIDATAAIDQQQEVVRAQVRQALNRHKLSKRKFPQSRALWARHASEAS